MKLKTLYFFFALILLAIGKLKAQEKGNTVMYLNPFQNTQMIDDHLLLVDNLGLTMDRVPMLASSKGTPLYISSDETPAYLIFRGKAYTLNSAANLDVFKPIITENKIDYWPLRIAPLYEVYEMEIPLSNTEYLGIKLLEYGYLDQLKINSGQ